MKFFVERVKSVGDSGKVSVMLLTWTFVSSTLAAATIHQQLPSAKRKSLSIFL